MYASPPQMTLFPLYTGPNHTSVLQVGQKPSQAQYYVNDNRGTVQLLTQLVAKGRQLDRRRGKGAPETTVNSNQRDFKMYRIPQWNTCLLHMRHGYPFSLVFLLHKSRSPQRWGGNDVVTLGT